MKRNQAAAILFGSTVAKFDHVTDFAGRADHHVPGQLGDLASAQASFERQQQDQMISARVSGSGGKDEEASCLLIGEYLGLFSRHNKMHRVA